MISSGGTTGRQLRSVALRYRQVLGISRMPGAGAGSVVRLLGRDGPDDEMPDGPRPGGRDHQLARLEAVLLLSREPQGSRKLAQLAGLADGTQARTLVRRLNGLYDGEGSAFRVEEVAGGFQLRTRAKFAPWLRRLYATPVEVRLSAPAMETLAVVAYRQPVLRAEIEAIRGVQCGEILRQLIQRDLIRIAGRSEELGRPLLYGTTKLFLEVFGLRHLDELANYFQPVEKELAMRTLQAPTAALGAPADGSEIVASEPLRDEPADACAQQDPAAVDDDGDYDLGGEDDTDDTDDADDADDEADDDDEEYEDDDEGGDEDDADDDEDDDDEEYEDDEDDDEEDDEDDADDEEEEYEDDEDDDEEEYEDDFDEDDEDEEDDEDDKKADDEFEDQPWEEVEDDEDEEEEEEEDEEDEEWDDDDDEEWDDEESEEEK